MEWIELAVWIIVEATGNSFLNHTYKIRATRWAGSECTLFDCRHTSSQRRAHRVNGECAMAVALVVIRQPHINPSVSQARRQMGRHQSHTAWLAGRLRIMVVSPEPHSHTFTNTYT